MADFVFNISKGKAKALYENVENNAPANSAFVLVLLKTAQADDTLMDYDDLAALLAAGGGTANVEANFTNYARKILTDADLAAVPAPDDVNNRLDLDLPDQTYVSAGGATNNTLVKLLVCYDPDTTSGTDATLVPITAHDFTPVTDGTDLVAQIAAAGFYRAA
jgi:hypothetical protein